MLDFSTHWPLYIGGIFASAYGLYFVFQAPSLLRTLVKGGATLMLALWAQYVVGAPLLTLALIFSAIGDVFLAGKPEKWLLPGMAAFAVAHVLYIWEFFQLGTGVSWPLTYPQLGLLLVVALYLSWLQPQLKEMRLPVSLYAVIIGVMGVVALSLSPLYMWAIIGALAFMASDTILALDLFVWEDDSRLKIPAAYAIWALYWGGQALIVYGVA